MKIDKEKLNNRKVLTVLNNKFFIYMSNYDFEDFGNTFEAQIVPSKYKDEVGWVWATVKNGDVNFYRGDDWIARDWFLGSYIKNENNLYTILEIICEKILELD